ncbi:MAG: hypothetical protein JO256_06250 [Alphaproteobacteria bacterium]|nr:hypothetical protein [Alphaproteobacteria bacterium]
MQICTKLTNDGFFTNFISALDWLAVGDEYGIDTSVDWSLAQEQANWDFSYGDVGAGNLWNLFFEPVGLLSKEVLIVRQPWTDNLRGFRAFGLYNDLEGGSFQRQRLRLNHALCRHVRLLPDIAARINSFAKSGAEGGVSIGVHLRNPVASQKLYCRPPALSRYIARVEQLVDRLPAKTPWGIFAAGDRQDFIDELADRFPGKVRSQLGVSRALPGGGEIHRRGERARSLGVEVITDCWLLSRCDFLLGVQSSVCLAACVINPAIQFVNVQTWPVRTAGRLEYELKRLYCAIFEASSPEHKATEDIVRMAQGAGK